MLFFVMCLTKVGVIQIFCAWSWFIVQFGLSVYLKNHKLMLDILPANETNTTKVHGDFETAFLESLLGAMHYGVLVPFGFIYVYALLYEVTYVTRAIHKRNKQKRGFNPMKAAMVILKHVTLFIAGMLFCSVLLIFVMNEISVMNLKKIFAKINQSMDTLETIPVGLIWTYLISCVCFMVLLGFSKFCGKFRYIVIVRYFKILQGELHPRADHFYAAKPKKKRMTKKELIAKRLRKQKELAKKDHKGAIDNAQPGSSTQVTVEQDSKIQNKDSVENEPASHYDGEFDDSDVNYSSESGSGKAESDDQETVDNDYDAGKVTESSSSSSESVEDIQQK